MNIETLLQAAEILESQQSISHKKEAVRSDRQTPDSPTPPSALSSPTTNLNKKPLSLSASSTIHENVDNRLRIDHNLNLHNFNHSIQPQTSFNRRPVTFDPDDDDDDDDDLNQNSQNTGKNNDKSNCIIQGSCFRDREIHNRLEKDRRAHLRKCFDILKAEVPCQRDRKLTNLQILNMAIKYIQALTRKEREYEQEMVILTSRNNELQRCLGTLKSELNSEGHNVDTWLSSCSDIDHSVSTCTASEAEMYQTFDNDADLNARSTIETKIINGDDDLNTNHNHHGMRSNKNKSYTINSKILFNNRKSSIRQRQKLSKRKLSSIPTTNLLHTLSRSVPIRSENLLDYHLPRQIHLDQSCNLLTTVKDNLSPTTTSTPIIDIRYKIIDVFTKGKNSHLQQHQQISPLPSIASLMNRHSSPVVSPTKQTIGINTDPLTTTTTNILHQTIATS